MIQPNSKLLFGAFIFGLFCHSAFAGKDDFQQQIAIDSGYQKADGINKTSIFIENVNITQGSLSINADEVSVLKGEGDNNEVFIAIGQPATYSQKLDDGTLVQASANKIEYISTLKTITLEGNAKLSQDGFKSEGEVIRFNIEKEALEAIGGSNGRVKTVFKPDLLEKTKQPE
jgi:lipopolysaccharide export system protein LptA